MSSRVPDDTIEVREDERFDASRLASFLRDRLPGADRPLRVRQFGGGKANLTYLLDYGTREYVLRRPPLGPIAASAHDMKREYSVLSVLHRAFPLAPQAHVFSDDTSILGAPFFVMERRRGLVVRERIPDAYAELPGAARKMSEALVDALVQLHGIDYESLGLEGLGRPRGFIERQIEGWYGRWQKARLEELPAMDRVYRWLRRECPEPQAASLIHNDYKLDNVALRLEDPGRIVAIYDWDMCTLGDPLSDLGALLCYWSEPGDPAYLRELAMMPVDPGFLSRQEIVERYAAGSDLDLSRVSFYHVLGLFRLVVIIAQIYIRYHRGQTRDARFAAFGDMVPRMAQAAEEVAGL